MKIEKWEVEFKQETEACTPERLGVGSYCIVCGKLVTPHIGRIHLTGRQTATIDFETFDEIPRVINLRMFDESLQDIDAHITRHTPTPGIQKCRAEFVIREADEGKSG